jgi:hypothetical protein
MSEKLTRQRFEQWWLTNKEQTWDSYLEWTGERYSVPKVQNDWIIWQAASPTPPSESSVPSHGAAEIGAGVKNTAGANPALRTPMPPELLEQAARQIAEGMVDELRSRGIAVTPEWHSMVSGQVLQILQSILGGAQNKI